jgi:hypothetical protein
MSKSRLLTEVLRPKRLDQVILTKRIADIIGDGELEINIDTEGSKPMAAFSLSFEIDYWTKPKNPFETF